MENEKKSGKWKIVILGIMLLIAILSFKMALAEICSSNTTICTENCTMFTPPISCSSYYVVTFDGSGQNISNQTLTHAYNSIYYFNFSHIAGQYVLALCDGTYKQVDVVNCSTASEYFYNISTWSLTGGKTNYFSCNSGQDMTIKIIILSVGLLLGLIGMMMRKASLIAALGGLITIVAGIMFYPCTFIIGILLMIVGGAFLIKSTFF